MKPDPFFTQKPKPSDIEASCCQTASPDTFVQSCCPENKPCSDDSEPCCGPPAGPVADIFDLPGYKKWHFVAGFIGTAAGNVPQVKTKMSGRDHLGTFLTRVGFGRNQYSISPGLYAVGNPDSDSPVLVTANFKLSFDSLRQNLAGIDAWILVIDTRGINVWCAAGKGTFGTAEIVKWVRKTRLDQVVQHRKLIVPQLGATGVNARQVKKQSLFKVIWGPIRADDTPLFLKNNCQASLEMRQVTFTLPERLVLIPVDLYNLPKPSMWVIAAAFIFSGIGASIFSFSNAWIRGLWVVAAYAVGIISGAVVVPALLPWLPGRAFAIKGAITGTAGGILLLVFLWGVFSFPEALALILFTTAVSSYLAMNFTGSTPFTSPTGVEKEMRRGIPAQLTALLAAIIFWVGSTFTA